MVAPCEDKAFGQPVSVETELFRRLHQADGLVHGLRRGVAADDGRLVENAEAHCESNWIIRGPRRRSPADAAERAEMSVFGNAGVI